MAVHGTDQATDRNIMWAVALVIGVLVAWVAMGSALGEAVGFVTAVLAGIVVAGIGWRHLITFELMCNLAMVGIPAAVLGLSLT